MSASSTARRCLLGVTHITVETPDPNAAGELAEQLHALDLHREGDHFELQIELGASYDSHAEHGRALASLLLALHGWLDNQQAASVDVTIDGRRITLHAPEPR
jgi:hypothetical protein